MTKKGRGLGRFFFFVVVEGLRCCEVFLGQGVANGKDGKVKRAGLML